MMILGIDLGTNSIGWALVELPRYGNKGKILSTGVRAFEAGMDGDIDAGKQESRNLKRREKRQLRRQHDRRRRRMQNVMRVLQDGGLMPKSDNMASAIFEIDQRAWERMSGDKMLSREDKRRLAHVVPYMLRAQALDARLSDFELGRALYHLAQRRGFLSNRKTAATEDEKESGKVKGGISELAQKIAASDSRTLGEYFSRVDPEDERVRGLYTGRMMFVDEFRKIMAAQREAGNEKLTDEFERALYRAMFRQRPLKSCRSLIGRCPYEPKQRRAAWHHPSVQEFRVLQKVNDLRLVNADTGASRELRTCIRKFIFRP